MAAEMVAGVTLRLSDGLNWIIPPLTIGQLRNHLAMLSQFTDMSPTTPWQAIGAEKIDALCGMVCAAMSRNYPDVTREAVAQLLDLRTFSLAIAAALNQPQPPTAQPQPPQLRAVDNADG